jgi:hypothetical protein
LADGKDKKKKDKEEERNNNVLEHGEKCEEAIEQCSSSTKNLDKKSKNKRERSQLNSAISEDITLEIAENITSKAIKRKSILSCRPEKGVSGTRKGINLADAEGLDRENISASDSVALQEDSLLGDTSTKKNAKSKKKRVTFVDQVTNEVNKNHVTNDEANGIEAFNEEMDGSIMPNDGEELWGVRFSREEDEIIKQAIFDYIKVHIKLYSILAMHLI